MQMKKYIGTTALLAVLASPAFAQTVIDQTASGIAQNSAASSVIFSPGVVVNSVLGQESTNVANGVGVLGAFAVSSPYTVLQEAGPGIVEQNAVNTNIAGSNASAVANVTVGGNQLASNLTNFANIAPGAGSTGAIGQIAGNTELFASNTMLATVQNGNASIVGANGLGGAGFQTAAGALNTGGVLVTDSTALKLNQEVIDRNTITATNSAIANAVASGLPTLDPSISTLNQKSSIGVNQMTFTSVAGPASVALSGAQNGPVSLNNDSLLGTLGNTAVAFTGTPAPGYNIGTNAPGDGIAVISGVTQNASFGLNNVSGGTGVSISLAAGAGAPPPAIPLGFTQTVDGLALGGDPVVTAPGNVLPGVVNGIAARTNTGSSTVTGVQGTLTQNYNMQLNSITTGGTLAGTATQTASDILQTAPVYTGGPLPVIGYANAVVADTVAGPSTITNVSQRMDQTINLAASTGTGAGGLNLTQTGNNIALSSNNVQAALGSTSATIAGAQQLANSALNVASLAGAGGTITQGSGGTISLSATNQLAAVSPYNASVSGFQSSSTAFNVIK